MLLSVGLTHGCIWRIKCWGESCPSGLLNLLLVYPPPLTAVISKPNSLLWEHQSKQVGRRCLKMLEASDVWRTITRKRNSCSKLELWERDVLCLDITDFYLCFSGTLSCDRQGAALPCSEQCSACRFCCRAPAGAAGAWPHHPVWGSRQG